MPAKAVALELPRAERAASLVYFNYGGARAGLLVQQALDIKQAAQGYDCTVLLGPESLPRWAVRGLAADTRADITAAATKTNLFGSIVELAVQGYFIDLFVFAAGGPGWFGQQPGATGGEHWVTAGDIAARLGPPATGFAVLPLRIVWGTNGYGSTLGETWRSVGAKAWSGARYVDFYPDRWANFIAAWNGGSVSLDAAAGNADTAAVRSAAQSFIGLVDAPAQKQSGAWHGCPFLTTVLGDDQCARDYFVSCWLGRDEWLVGRSGRENMDHSACHLRGGETSITKRARPRWTEPAWSAGRALGERDG